MFHQMLPLNCDEFTKRVKHGQSMKGKNVMGWVLLVEAREMFPIK